MATVGEIRDFAIFALSVNDSQLNDDINAAHWLEIIQQAYNKVVIEFQEVVPREVKIEKYDFTWPAGQLTFDISTDPTLRNATIQYIILVNDAGIPAGEFSGYFETKNVLRIPPGYDVISTNVRVYYIPVAEKLQLAQDQQIPLLIPEKFHDILKWGSLCLAKELADKAVPGGWTKRYEDLKFNLAKWYMARPKGEVARIRLPGAPMLRPLI